MTGPKLNEKSFVAGERSGTKATAKYVRTSASRARAVLDLIRGLDVRSADEVLQFTDRHVARDIRKVLASAVANAVNNDDQDAEELYVVACFADEGPTLRRFRPRARGRATRINKRSCHITVIVARMSDDRIAVIQARQERAGGSGGRGRPQSSAASRRARVERSRQQAAEESGDDVVDAEITDDETTAAEVDEATAEAADDQGAVDATATIAADAESEAAETEAAAEAPEADATTTEEEEEVTTPEADGAEDDATTDAAAEGSANDDTDEDESENVSTAAEGSASDEAEPVEENQRADEKGKS
jgi:large subunit ribosomal protein L22